MKVYNVYWKQTLIGTLYEENAQHKYVPNKDGIESVQNEPINPVLENFRDWGDVIPFFKIRLEAHERFENLEIGLLTDHTRMIQVVN